MSELWAQATASSTSVLLPIISGVLWWSSSGMISSILLSPLRCPAPGLFDYKGERVGFVEEAEFAVFVLCIHRV